MTENLRLQDVTITGADSNIESGKTVAIPASSTANWCDDVSAACDNQLMTLDATDTSISGQEDAQSDYGVYYNWYTTTATYGTFSMSSGSVSYDICPKSWKLPTGGSSGEFQALFNNYNSIALMSDIPDFTLSGYYSSSPSSSRNQGSGSYYWSSTTDTDEEAKEFAIYVPNSYIGNSFTYKNIGCSVRCLAQ